MAYLFSLITLNLCWKLPEIAQSLKEIRCQRWWEVSEGETLLGYQGELSGSKNLGFCFIFLFHFKSSPNEEWAISICLWEMKQQCTLVNYGEVSMAKSTRCFTVIYGLSSRREKWACCEDTMLMNTFVFPGVLLACCWPAKWARWLWHARALPKEVLLQAKIEQWKYQLPSKTPQPNPSLDCALWLQSPKRKSTIMEQDPFLYNTHIHAQQEDNNLIFIPSPLAEGSYYSR